MDQWCVYQHGKVRILLVSDSISTSHRDPVGSNSSMPRIALFPGGGIKARPSVCQKMGSDKQDRGSCWQLCTC